ncbi:MAG: NAD kinase [Chloroflexota bacterium]|nr:MAG: NAD kinase [Chloroflexota bacterium]
MTTFNCVGILAHPLRPHTAPVAQYVAATLAARGIHHWERVRWAEEDVLDAVAASDLVVAIGGDGAMLRAARVCARFGVPVLGVNKGLLGFLTEIDNPTTWEAHLDRLLNGGYWIEKRMMVRAAIVRNGAVIGEAEALNDIVVSRGVVTRTVRFETYIDSGWATTYNADAVIIATPTGSTAYALACGGPILSPELANILIVPVAPHLSMDRPIVLAQGAVVEVIPSPDADREIVVTFDGQLFPDVRAGDLVRVQTSSHTSRFVRLRERGYFYRSLLDRLEPPHLTPPGHQPPHQPPKDRQ